MDYLGWKYWIPAFAGRTKFEFLEVPINEFRLFQTGNEIILKTAVERYQPFETPAARATQGERTLTKLETAPFVLSALRSKAYRSLS